MRWDTLWLTAVLIATASANTHKAEIDIEHIVKVIPEQIVIPDADITRVQESEHTEILNTVDEDSEATLPDNPEDNTNREEDDVEKSESEEDSENKEPSDEITSEQKTTSEEKDDEETSTKEDDSAVKPSSEAVESESHADITAERSSSAESANVEKSVESEQTLNEDLIVTTKTGQVQGFIWQDKENIISYIDIPYGSIKEYFQGAMPADSWEHVHSEKDHNKRCPQLDGDTYVGDTDCLTLSVFKPTNAQGASVLFHIHAENFDTGSGDPSIYGPDYLVANDIILVLPNYRLGPLGFLCMQNETAPGNMALKDLSLALSWVYSNIEAFGGNHENIAVSGEGRSGALAGLLALSPMSKMYVSKVIAESGSFLSYWALGRDPTATAAALMDRIQDNDDGVSRVDISLTEVPIQTILVAAKGLEFRPCLESEENNFFMSVSPYKMITTEKFENTKFLLGSAMYAGVHEALLQSEDSIKKLNEDFALLLPDDLSFSSEILKSEMGNRVKQQYFGDEAISLEDIKHLSLCFTDTGYLSPGIRSARLLVDADATVFFYEFAYVGDLNRVLHSVNKPVEGAVRGDIVGYLFTQDGVMPTEEQTAESKMVDTLTKMWTNFLKTGSPSTEEIEWNSLEKEAGEGEEQWLLIDAEPTMKKGLHIERLPLWTEIYRDHFIEGSHGQELSPSVYTVLILQLVFWVGFWRNASHIY